jgi:hypothetical protein
MVKTEASHLTQAFNKIPYDLFLEHLFHISFWNFIRLNTGCSSCFILLFIFGLDELNT